MDLGSLAWFTEGSLCDRFYFADGASILSDTARETLFGRSGYPHYFTPYVRSVEHVIT